MNEAELPAEVTSVTLTLRLDATISVSGGERQYDDWLKPGAEASITWKGIPDEETVRVGFAYLQGGMIAPALEDVIVSIHQRLVEARRNG